MHIKVKRLSETALMPVYGSQGAACFDIAADILRPITLYPGEAQAFPTGLMVEVPFGFAMKLYSRSGHGFKNGLRLANCVGIIDSDYRGEVIAKIHNDSENKYTIEPGERILQAEVVPVVQCTFEEVEQLSATVRGEQGFGSTGTVHQPSLFHPEEETRGRIVSESVTIERVGGVSVETIERRFGGEEPSQLSRELDAERLYMK